MNFRSYIFVSLIILLTFQATGQGPKKKKFVINRKVTVDMREAAFGFNQSLKIRKLPKPNPGADKMTIDAVRAGL